MAVRMSIQSLHLDWKAQTMSGKSLTPLELPELAEEARKMSKKDLKIQMAPLDPFPLLELAVALQNLQRRGGSAQRLRLKHLMEVVSARS